MKKLLLLISFNIFLNSTVLSFIYIDPHGIYRNESSWHKGSEYYYDYYSKNGKPIMRVLDRFVPNVNAIIESAKIQRSNLILHTPYAFYDSLDKINNNLMVVVPEKNLVKIEPSDLRLEVKSKCCGSRYFLAFTNVLENHRIEVSEEVYDLLMFAINQATSNTKLIRIDILRLRKSSGNTENIVTVVDK